MGKEQIESARRLLKLAAGHTANAQEALDFRADTEAAIAATLARLEEARDEEKEDIGFDYMEGLQQAVNNADWPTDEGTLGVFLCGVLRRWEESRDGAYGLYPEHTLYIAKTGDPAFVAGHTAADEFLSGRE